MDLFDVIRSRYSVRAYRNAPVDETAVQAILQSVNDAPSAGNRQAYEIVLIRDPACKRRLAKASLEQGFIADAPIVLVFLANPDRNRDRYGRRGADLYSVQDATIACAYAQLAATALGLGSCWIGAFDESAVRVVVDAPASWCPVAILPIGHPADAPEPRQRRALSDLVHPETAGR